MNYFSSDDSCAPVLSTTLYHTWLSDGLVDTIGEGGGERGPGGRAQHLQPPEREKTVRAKSILKTVMIS